MRRILLLAISVLLVPIFSVSSDEWKREYHDSVVTIYSREVPGYTHKEYKSISEVNSHISVVFDVFAELNLYDKWYGFCKNSYSVKTHSLPIQNFH